MANTLEDISRRDAGKTQQIIYDPELEKYFEVIKRGSPVSSRDTTQHFSPQTVKFFAERGALPYTLDLDSNHLTFALDKSRYEENTMSPPDFRVQFGDLIDFLPQEIKKIIKDDSKISFSYMSPDLIGRLRPFVSCPENIEGYYTQKAAEANIARGIITDRQINSFVDNILNWAIASRASDIHFEHLGTNQYRVRLRVDGVMHEPEIRTAENRTEKYRVDEVRYKQAIVVLKNRCGAGVKVDERRRPQDGKLTYTPKEADIEGNPINYDLRVAFRPVIGDNENVILRIAKRGAFKKLEELGLSDYDYDKLTRVCIEPNGIVLITGPTGSGKTTTLYGVLHSINVPTRKIITIEDPVEVQISGLQQTQVHEQIGVDFPSFLKFALRSDPDVILVGEIRDDKTAEIATEAARTGHLVWATLHTNNASGAVNRLKGMNIPPMDLAETLRGVMAQTLVPVFEESLKRRIKSGNLTSEDIKLIKYIDGGLELNKLIGEQFYKSGTLTFCNGLENAFSGREVLTEFWEIDERSQEVIANPNAGVVALAEVAEQSGMRPMFISGVEKAQSKRTSLQTILDNTGTQVFMRKKEILKRYIQP